MRSGRSRPACSARSQPVLRATPDSKPSRKAPAVAPVSALPNTGPIRSFRAARSGCHATSEPDQTVTDIDSLPDLTCPGEGHIPITDAAVVLGTDPDWKAVPLLINRDVGRGPRSVRCGPWQRVGSGLAQSPDRGLG